MLEIFGVGIDGNHKINPLQSKLPIKLTSRSNPQRQLRRISGASIRLADLYFVFVFTQIL